MIRTREIIEIHCKKCGPKAVTLNGRICIRRDKFICNGEIYKVKRIDKTMDLKLCPNCDIPLHIHQTACGWDNVCILHNGVMISGDKLEAIWKQLTPIKT